ncbi:uncharacterized protein L201_007008 [Kwoniella dendrophila CBS 6074]|uniref:Glycosyl transferase CAP10 domain-containing protein n=1 Tax=Kwoniella dendrophila CBS 6074 TaxID=1295534 RepID=A0AAX4K3U5_9TREE
MSLRAHTYISPSISPKTFSQPWHAQPVSPTLADQKHHSQLHSYKRDPTKAAAAIRLAGLQQVWGKAEQRRRSEEELEDGEISSKYRRRRWSFLKGLVGISVGSSSRRWVVYVIGIMFIYITFLRPMLSKEDQVASYNESFGQNSSSSSKSLSSKRISTIRSAVPRAPLPPALLAKRSVEHKIENGLLKVNPKSTVHPIHQLIRDAREEWDNKVARQSKTLAQAVREYQKRYKRKPPKGFDKWWAYVVENGIPLPDEYDQIERDLLPFRALSPRDLNNRIEAASQLADTFTMRVKRGSVRTNVFYSENIHGADERLDQQAELLSPIAQWLPDMEIVWSVHDTPRNIIGYDYRRELVEHVEEEEWFDADDEIDLTLSDWSAACPPRSPLRNFNHLSGNPTWIPNTKLSNKKFISSHSKSMDLCQHPEIITIHGSLAGKIPKVSELIPIFTLSKTNLHSDILGVPVEQWTDDVGINIPFEEKKENKLLWRGSNTGTTFSQEIPWRTSHRTRLIYLTNYFDNQLESDEQGDGDEQVNENLNINYIPPPKSMRNSKIELEKIMKKANLGRWNERSMDLGFTGTPIQCDVDDGTCDDLMEEFSWADQMTHEEALNYKYVIDIDGNAWSARFKRLLTSGSLIFKSTIMPEWWTDRIQPWVHYVPIQLDYSDLYDIMAFFQGLPSTPGESALARDIANSGRIWSDTHWRKEDMIAYMFRLYLEWGRLVADNRRKMDFQYYQSMEMTRE